MLDYEGKKWTQNIMCIFVVVSALLSVYAFILISVINCHQINLIFFPWWERTTMHWNFRTAISVKMKIKKWEEEYWEVKGNVTYKDIKTRGGHLLDSLSRKKWINPYILLIVWIVV